INSLIDQIAETELIVEINTKMFAQRNRLFPSPRYWKRLVNAKIPVIFNSDAHVPALIPASRDKVIAMFNSITH
ncbi:MAG: histidinol-phosphatase, partial [Muribaculaceae bacterium]|nr:histidinol-phosphatase [Muribaculaceae bacterium]